MVSEQTSSGMPRFKRGDRVIVIGPLSHPNHNKVGMVAEIIGATASVPRYLVRFDDDSRATFFSFELDLAD
jgi:hypothetical protein